MNDRQQDIEKAHAKTFECHLEDMSDMSGTSNYSFLTWLRGPETLFWISGKAGSGKSTLMNYLYHHPKMRENLLHWASEETIVLAGYFFFERGLSKLQKSREGLLRSILYQVICQRPELAAVLFPSRLSEIVSTYGWNGWTWSELSLAFRNLLEQTQCEIKLCLFIDGLDEYRRVDKFDDYDYYDGDESERAKKISEGHSEISQLFLNASSYPSIKLCLSSRPLLVFGDAFGDGPLLRLEELTSQDISIFVNDKLGGNKQLVKMSQGQPQVKSDLVQEIVSKASGVFLWVKLVVDILLRGLQERDRIKDLREKLKLIPGELGGRNGLYMRMLKDISPQNRLQGYRLFQIVLAARHNLTALALSFAEEEDTLFPIQLPVKTLKYSEIAIRGSHMEGRLKSRCAGLLEMQPRPGSDVATTDIAAGCQLPHINAEPVVQFLHLTTKEFIEQRENWELLLPDKDLRSTVEANTSLLSSCLSRIKLVGPTASPEDLWSAVKDAIFYAEQAERTTNTAAVELLSSIDQSVNEWFRRSIESSESRRLDRIHQTFQSNFSASEINRKSMHWSVYEPQESDGKFTDWRGDFMSLAVQGSLSLYLEKSLGKDVYEAQKRPGRPLLSYAVTPQRLFTTIQHSPYNTDCLGLKQASPNTTRVLLSRGMDPNQIWHGSDYWTNPGSSIWQSTLAWAYQNKKAASFDLSRWFNNTELLLSYGADPNVTVSIGRDGHHRARDAAISTFSALYIVSAILWEHHDMMDALTSSMIGKGAHLLLGEKEGLITSFENTDIAQDTARRNLKHFKERSRPKGDRGPSGSRSRHRMENQGYPRVRDQSVDIAIDAESYSFSSRMRLSARKMTLLFKDRKSLGG